MKLGELVSYRCEIWFVLRVMPAARVVTLINQSKRTIEVPDSLEVDSPEECIRIAHPAKEWNLLAAGVKRNAGPLKSLCLPPDGRIRPKSQEFTPWVDWIQSDPFRAGGSLLVRPNLPIRKGDVLIGTFTSGSRVSLPVSGAFGTVAERRVKQAPAFTPKEETNRFDRTLRWEDD